MRTRLALLALLIPSAALAQEFRAVQLADGRTLRGEVLASTAEGMEVRVPQGRVLVQYGDLTGVNPITEAEVRGQEPLRIGLAPVAWADPAADDVAWQADAWLPRVLRLVPEVQVLPPAAWAAATGRSTDSLRTCGGDVECLLGDGPAFALDLLFVPTVVMEEGPTLVMKAYAASSRKQLGQALAPITVVSGTVDPGASGRAAAEGVFPAIGMLPDIDVLAAAEGQLPEPIDVEALTEPEPEPEPEAERVSEPEPRTEPPAEPEPEPEDSLALGAAPRSTQPRKSLRKALELGALPVPGLSSIYLKDPVGAATSIAGTVGVSWLSIYGYGRGARTAPAFWLPSIVTPYALNVAFNEVSALVGWRRLHGAKASLVPVVAATPWTNERGDVVGVWFNIGLQAR